jgi:squalene synthase HpnC
MSAVPRTLTADALPGTDELLHQAGNENFTVANRLLGTETCRHLMAIYGYARLVDDVGDEAPGDREALLDVVEEELAAVYEGRGPEHPVMRELAVTVRARDLPEGPFHRLLAANRMDQTVTRYETWQQLMDYCALSATPVGELVLGVFGVATPERIELSDRICAGLQVVEHLQDIGEDHARGRIYLPAEDMRRFGVPEESLNRVALPGEPLPALVAFEAERARRLLASGAPLARTLPLRPRLAIAGFVAGGRAALAGLPIPDGRPSEPSHRARTPAFAAAFVRAVLGR